MKLAKVITTCFGARIVREETGVSGFPPGLFSHSQRFETEDEIIQLIKLNIKYECKFKQKLGVDIIIVNNDIGSIIGANFLKEINELKLPSGVVRVLTRENIGRSFGGYDYAFKTFGDQYDYYLFTEDDIVVWGDGYAEYAVNYFNSTANCGFVAFQGISKRYKNWSVEDSIHVHGGVGLTSPKVLLDVVRAFGSLPHASDDTNQSYETIIEDGEVRFTNSIAKLGYKLCDLPANLKFYDYAYDLLRNRNINKRYLNTAQTLLYNFKRYLGSWNY
jgi:hypothetical protein